MPPLKLQDFASPSIQAEPEAEEDDAARMAAYEEGYGAGWEDAMAAQAGTRSEVEAEVAGNLRALTLTAETAEARVLSSIEPLIVGIVTRILPEIAREALSPTLAEVLLPLADSAAHCPIRLRAAPDALPVCEAFLGNNGLSMTVIPDTGLTGCCVVIEGRQSETRIDLDAAGSSILEAVRTFFATQQMERQHAE